MGSSPKRWVIKPLTPKLEKSDLRPMLSPYSESHSLDNSWTPSQNGDSSVFKFDAISVSRLQPVAVSAANEGVLLDVVAHATQVLVSEESSASEDWQPSNLSTPSSPSSTDSRVGFYSFVEDPTSPEAEKNEAYMVSPERQARLSTLTEKNSFKLQTYAEDRRPEKLFQDTNGDSRYQLEDNLADSNGKDKVDRKEIIRSQAPKKNLALKEQWSALENLDLSKPPHHLVQGFSLCYSPVSTKVSQPEAEAGSIDSQQIDFNSARKQFLMMEHSKQNPFQLGPQEMSSSPKPWGTTKEHNRKLKGESNHQEEKTVTFNEDSKGQVQNRSTEDLVSGLGYQSMSYKREGNLSSEPSKLEMRESSSVSSMSETPIEREIRIAQEREEDLRRSRGILRSDTSEMVEIKTKPILSQPLSQVKPIKAKETSRVSFFIQRELERVNQGQSLYEKETPRELGEGSRTFVSESDQEPIISSGINPIATLVSVDDTWTAERSVFVDQTDGSSSSETLSPCCPHRHKDEAKIRRGTSHTSAGETLGGTVKKSYTMDANISNPPFWMAAYKSKEPGRTLSSKHSPSSSPEPVRGSQAEVAWSHLESTTEWPCMMNAPDVIRREIEEDLRREQELQKLRESSSLSLSAHRGTDTTETSLPPLITSENKSEQNSIDSKLGTALITSLNSSQENPTEKDTALPGRQRTSDSPFFSLNADSTPVSHMSLSGSRFPVIMTAQPWSSQRSTAAVLRGFSLLPAGPQPGGSSTLSHKGLTETLLEDFEERRTRLKLEESAYAGIQPVDPINNAVVDATRVTKRKSSKALRWEAGVYANKDN